VKIIIQRGRTIPFEALPDHSVALDGYVQGPAIDVKRQRYSFDHHAGCLRLVTKATCAQVLDALLLGLDPREMNIYLNDIDADTVLAVWLLKHPHMATHVRVRTLVEDVGNIDAHGPAFFHFVRDNDLCQRFFKGAMAPETQARQDGSYASADLYALLKHCLKRTGKLLFHNYRFPVLPRERRAVCYELTHSGSGWVMIRSPERAFGALYRDGHTRVVSYHELITHHGGQAQTSYAYTIAKQSDLVSDFDIPAILARLAAVEPGWGGGSSIGGAPRHANGSRSQLPPDTVFEIIENHVQASLKGAD
jgi:hypothetical protein